MKNDIKTQIFASYCTVEDNYQQLISECSKLYKLIAPYLSGDFHNGSTYIDRLPGDGIALITELDEPRIYPLDQIIDLIERGGNKHKS